MTFSDRRAAGRALAARLTALSGEHPIVIALPRGGVPVGFEVAHALSAPLDILAVRKLAAPANPELGVGAMTADGAVVLDRLAARRAGMTPPVLEATIARETRELRRRVACYRDACPALDVVGRTVIVVDDGLATGLTDLAAVRALRARGAARIVVAAPVGGRDAIALVAGEADEVICHTIPDPLLSIGRSYDDFRPVEDEEVIGLLAEAAGGRRGRTAPAAPLHRELHIELPEAPLTGDLTVPPDPRGLVIFGHGSGASRLSPRNRAVATSLNSAGFATLLFDLLTRSESSRRALVFDIALLARRLELVTRMAIEEPMTGGLPIGYFGASTGAAAALRAAAAAGPAVHAVVARGGRPDLAADRLPYVDAPTLLIVGSLDTEVLALNRRAAAVLRCPHRVAVVEGAGHLFDEPGTLEVAAALAAEWFGRHMPAAGVAPSSSRAMRSGSRLTATGRA